MNRCGRQIAALVCGIVLTWLPSLDAEEKELAREEIPKLIQRLGDDEFAEREKATRALERLGDPAWEALWKALVESKDPEVVQRARAIIESIEASWKVRVIRGHSDAVPSLSLSSDGRLLLSAGRSEGVVRLWELKTWKEVRQFRATGAVGLRYQGRRPWVTSRLAAREWTWDAVFSPDGASVLLASGHLRSLNRKTGKVTTRFLGHDQIVEIDAGPDGKTAVSGSSRDTFARVWDVVTGKEIRQLRGHAKPVWNVAYSPNGKRLLSCSEDGTIRMWDANTGKQLQILKGHTAAVTSAEFLPDGKSVVSSSWDKTLRLWDVTTGKTIRVFRSHTDKVCEVAVSPAGNRIASVSADKTVRLWDLSSGKLLRIYRGHEDTVGCVVFYPKEALLVSGSYDKSIRVWRLPK